MRKPFIALALLFTVVLAACGGAAPAEPTAAPAEPTAAPAEPTAASSTDPIIMVWLPNESGAELDAAREAIGAVVTRVLGRPVEHQLTTDYIIAVEAMASDSAHLGFFGAEAYVQAHDKNAAVVPLVIPSGASGTADDAVDYSWLAVNRGQEGEYQLDGAYTIDNIQGKRFSFVSNSSTSGFRVPSANIVKYFSQQDTWKDLVAEDLLEGSADGFFSDVQFGGSHQGSAVNLIDGNADVAAFCDVCVDNYVDLAEGTENAAGAVYRVIEGADEPFDKFPGAEFVVISSTPVINAPFVANGTMLTAEEIAALQAALTADDVANDPSIFATKEAIDAGFKPLFKKTKEERFIVVPDSFFDPVRALR